MSEPLTSLDVMAKYVTHDEFSEFRKETRAGFASIGDRIDKWGETLSRRDEEIRTQAEAERKQLSRQIAERGQTSWPVVMGVVGLAVSLILSGVTAVAWLSQITTNNQTKLEYVTEWRKSTERWMEDNEDRDNTQDVAISALNGYDDQLQIRLEGIDDRAERLEAWYNGHGQQMWADISAVKAINDHHEKEIEAIKQDLTGVLTSRYNAQDGARDRDRIIDLGQRIASLEARIKEKSQ